MNRGLVIVIVVGIASLGAWAVRRAAFSAHLDFDQAPTVFVDGAPWLGFAGQCACFRESLRVEAKDPVVIDLEDRALRGQGTIELRVLADDAPVHARELMRARSFYGLAIGHRRVGIDVLTGSFDWMNPHGEDH